jgi:hypothetical protein
MSNNSKGAVATNLFIMLYSIVLVAILASLAFSVFSWPGLIFVLGVFAWFGFGLSHSLGWRP